MGILHCLTAPSKKIGGLIFFSIGCYLNVLNKRLKRVCSTLVTSLCAYPEHLAHRQNVQKQSFESVRKGVVENLAKFTEKCLCLKPANLLKKTLAQAFSCEFYEIFNNTFSYRTPLVAASECRQLSFLYVLLWQMLIWTGWTCSASLFS